MYQWQLFRLFRSMTEVFWRFQDFLIQRKILQPNILKFISFNKNEVDFWQISTDRSICKRNIFAPKEDFFIISMIFIIYSVTFLMQKYVIKIAWVSNFYKNSTKVNLYKVSSPNNLPKKNLKVHTDICTNLESNI